MVLNVLDEKAIRDIHDTALMMLQSIGMEVAGNAARQAFLDAGAVEEEGRIRIREKVVEEALSAVPQDGFELVGRDPKRRCHIAPGKVHFRPAGGLPFVIDYPSRMRRSATLADMQTFARVVDALDGIDIANCAVSPAEIGVGINNVLRFVSVIRNSTKPTDITSSGPDEVAAVAEIADVVRDGSGDAAEDPLVLIMISPTSPLRISESEALAVIECAKRKIPFGPLSCPTLAATAPATMAGGIAQQWAEELALIVLAYGVCPGLPVMACSRINPADMRRGTTILSGAATGLMTAAFADLAGSFNIPCNGWGFTSSSQSPDLQAGAERATGAMLAALSGTSIISGAGTLGNALIATAEQLVIDNEIIGMVRSACEGVEVTADTLAHGFLAEGVREGTFLASRHTIEHLRSGKMWMADLFSTEPYEECTEKGNDLIDRAGARVREILDSHEPPALDRAQADEIESLLKSFHVHAPA